jgi:hypothetical protein
VQPPEADPERFWVRWHRDYDDPASRLSQRLRAVTRRTRQAVDAAPPGTVRLISACAGQGRDVVAALVDHPRAGDVVGRLVELDPYNCEVAQGALVGARLSGIECVCADAALTDAFDGAVPANVVLLCGIFGNITDDDIRHTAQNAARLCAPGAWLIWTRHRRSPDITPRIRQWFTGAGFELQAFDAPDESDYCVATFCLTAPPLAFQRGIRLFTFVR